MPCDTLREKVEQKVGRNVLKFQQVEFCLKRLLVDSNVSGSLSDIEEILSKKQDGVSKSMLGQLLKLFQKEVLRRLDKTSENEVGSVSYERDIVDDGDAMEAYYEKTGVMLESQVEKLIHGLPANHEYMSLLTLLREGLKAPRYHYETPPTEGLNTPSWKAFTSYQRRG